MGHEVCIFGEERGAAEHMQSYTSVVNDGRSGSDLSITGQS